MDEEEKGRPRWVVYVWLPALAAVISGIVLLIAQFSVPLFFHHKQELSYQIEGPTTLFSGDSASPFRDARVVIHGETTTTLTSYRISVWNSGDVPLTSLSMLVRFTPEKTSFKIYQTSTETQPAFEFGDVNITNPDQNSTRFTFSLLNPHDKYAVTFLANGTASVNAYSKAPDLKVKQIVPDQKPSFWEGWLAQGAITIIGVVLAEAVLANTALKHFSRRRRR